MFPVESTHPVHLWKCHCTFLHPSIQLYLTYCCNSLNAGHLGLERTFERLHREGYLVKIIRVTEQHALSEMQHMSKSKESFTWWILLVNIPVGYPWTMVAVDILEVPFSCNNNPYLLVIQEHFTKGPDAITLPDLTAELTAAWTSS